MAGQGPAPKPSDKRRRRNADRIPTTIIEGDGQAHGPDLPDSLQWPAETRRWWETWRSSPQAEALLATDWDFLLDTALLHARFWAGDAKVAGELRLRVAKFGATPEDRARLRMQVGEPDKPKATDAPAQSPYSHLRAAG